MIPLEQYAELAAWMIDTAADMGKTAMAFMPLCQAAQSEAHIGADTIPAQPNPQFDAALAQCFRGLMQSGSDRVPGMVR